MGSEIESLKTIVDKVLAASGEDSVHYREAVIKAIDASEKVMALLEGLRDGNSEAVHAQVTEFEEVNKLSLIHI